MKTSLLLLSVFVVSLSHAANKATVRLSAGAPRTVHQQGSEEGFSGPVLGFLTNQEGTELRAITGVPGAALVSQPIALPEAVGRVFLAPSQQWAVVEKRNGSGLAAMLLDSPNLALQDIAGSFAHADVIAFSPSGTRLAVYSKAVAMVQIIARHADSIQVEREFGSDIAPRRLAIDDAGLAPVIETEAGVLSLTNDGMSRIIYSGRPAFMTYASNSGVLYVGDSDTWRITRLEGASRSVLGAALPEGSAEAWSSLDGNSLFIVSGRDGIRIWPLEGRAERVSLPAAGGLLSRLRTGDAFLFSAEPDDPAWLLFSDSDSIHVSFAGRTEVSEPSLGEERGRHEKR